jgi:hypothetical protein
MPIDPVAPADIPAPAGSPSRRGGRELRGSTDDRWADPDSTTSPRATMSAERLREVLDRLKTRFYDRPEVQDRIARSLSKDLGSQPME